MTITKRATLKLSSMGCVSCKRAIEHGGRHFKEVKDINLDLASGRISVIYEDNGEPVIEKIQNVVSRIGYDAELEDVSEEEIP
ncbi:MAG: heavy-metal-associated domain-containing protein [Spirochaetales bacterium]|nr:heavy-metal-associated domain-containing protein [Spirochaetales bacterium]